MSIGGFTPFAIYSVLPWLLLSPLQYGYAISALNQIKVAISCKDSTASGPFGYSLCVPMTDTEFSVVTSIFLLGGLAGSLVVNRIMDPKGRRFTVQLNTVLVGLGSLIMATAGTVFALSLGRLLIGIGSGIGLCVIPPFLSEISPPRIKGPVGVLNQLSVVFGILFTQIVGLNFAQPGAWRIVFLISFVAAIIQFIIGTKMIESPAWLSSNAKPAEAKQISALLWVSAGEDVEEALLRDNPPPQTMDSPPATVAQCFSSKDLRKPLLIVSLAMIVQQLSGINAVMYYSTDILSSALPDAAGYVSLGVAVFNVIATFPAIWLLSHLGHIKLLLASLLGSLASLVLLGFSLNYHWTMFSSVATLAFVGSFAVGLGPVPFVIIPHVSPLHAVSALSSIALSANWIVNFFIGMTFLPIRNWLTDGAGNGAGTIFFIFATLTAISSIIFLRSF